jgi:hypothetical protein
MSPQPHRPYNVASPLRAGHPFVPASRSVEHDGGVEYGHNLRPSEFNTPDFRWGAGALLGGWGLLAAGCWLLAAGCWLLAAGCSWPLAAGCWLLAVPGCWLVPELGSTGLG